MYEIKLSQSYLYRVKVHSPILILNDQRKIGILECDKVFLLKVKQI